MFVFSSRIMAGLQTDSQFPAGLRVLVVDDDATCLRILDRMLRRLLYHVTICSQATAALEILREQKGCFDLVLSDVHMPDMDGYKLLEHIGLEMDLPVIMMSGDGRTSAVMRGIKHGACDYLIKPVREEELKNIWQHVVRKKWNENKEVEQSGTVGDDDRNRRGNDDAENASSNNEGSGGSLRNQKRRNGVREEENEDEMENEDLDPTASKKPRVVWSVELHQQFVSAVNQLGIDKAVPKRILELMNVPGLTRENVASHLQKFRLYLKRLSGVAPRGAVSDVFCQNVESNVKLGTLRKYDIQALAASGQIHPQALAALLGRPVGNLVPAADQPATLLKSSLQGPKCIPVDRAMALGQSLVKCQSNNNSSKNFQHSGFGVWPSDDNLGTIGGSNVVQLISQNSSLLADMSQLQSQMQQKPQCEANRTINVQPSCLVVPSQSSNSFRTISSPASVDQNISFNKGEIFDYSLLSPLSNNSSLNLRQISEGDPKPADVLSGYPVPGPLSSCASSCSVKADNNHGSLQIPNSNMVFRASRQPSGLASNVCNAQGSYGAIKPTEAMDQIPNTNLGSARSSSSFPTRFAIDEFESSMNNGKTFPGTNGARIKQEGDADFRDNIKVGTRVVQQFPSNNLTSVFTK